MKHDLIIFGATSFVGQIITQHTCDYYGLNGTIDWAIAGRSQEKLESIIKDCACEKQLIYVADSFDEASLRELCAKTRVIVSTVGPYEEYGELLIKVCAETGTHYCDLTGELPWVKAMIDKYEKTAQKSGAIIVNCSGFDSIPSDMGVYFLQNHAQKIHNKPCTDIKMRTRVLKGGVSGGTVASLMGVIHKASKDSTLRKNLLDPYFICPENHPYTKKQNENIIPHFDKTHKKWASYFIMASINTRVVHRSNALLNHAYGKDFTYSEAMLVGKGIKGRLLSYAISSGISALLSGGAFSPSRKIISLFLPSSGEGPSPEEQQSGFYDLRFTGRFADDSKPPIYVKVTGDQDPGYGSTAKILLQVGVSLAFNVPKKTKGGFLTPAALFKDDLIEKLIEHAGMTFEVLDAPNA